MSHFNFFGLPRELRDRIYGEVGGQEAKVVLDSPGEPTTTTPTGDKLGLCFKNAFQKSMLLVCTLFSCEYQEEIRRRSTVWACGLKQACEGELFITLSDHHGVQKQLQSITNLEINLWDSRFGHDHQITLEQYDDFHNSLLEEFLPWLPALKHIKLHIDLAMKNFDFEGTDLDFWKVTFAKGWKKTHVGRDQYNITWTFRFFGELYCFWPSYRPTMADKRQHIGLRDMEWEDFCSWWQEFDQENSARYLVLPAKSEPSFHGLDLSRSVCGSYDFEKMACEYDAVVERIMAGTSSSEDKDNDGGDSDGESDNSVEAEEGDEDRDDYIESDGEVENDKDKDKEGQDIWEEVKDDGAEIQERTSFPL